jgi:large subunit ribosomal protein L4
VLDGTLVDAPKTKQVVGLLARLKALGTVLIVADGATEHVLLACRNLRYVDVTTSGEVNAYALLKSDKIIFTVSAFTKLEERLRM